MPGLIDTAGAVPTMPAPSASVTTPGWFADGNPATNTPYTVLSPDWCNGLQAEIVNLLASNGQTPSKTQFAQILSAIQATGKRDYVDFTPGTRTFTVPANVYYLYCELWGGGGGSTGGVGSSGGGGGYCAGYTSVTPGQVITYTVGAAGLGSGSVGSATSGGNSSFLTLTANGGGAGNAGPGPGGTGSGGSTIQGQGGTDLDGSNISAPGGNSPRGGMGGMLNSASAAQTPTAPGGGAGSSSFGGFQAAAQGGIWLKY